MIDGLRVLAYIPARGGSKGVPLKNIRDLGGRPLLVHTVRAALVAPSIDYVLVSTDSEDIASVAREAGAQTPFLRPAELASDTARNIDGICDAVARLAEMGESFDAVAVLQPTSPFRDAADIEGALRCFVEHGRRGLVSVSAARDFPILMRTMDAKTGELSRLLDLGSTVRRQDMPEYLRVDGAIAVNLVSEISSELSINDNPVGYRLEPEHALEIDTLDDLEAARRYIERLRDGLGTSA